MNFNIEIEPKIKNITKEMLHMIYTPGVGKSCVRIKDEEELVEVYTNKVKSFAIISNSYKKSLEQAVNLKEKFDLDFYPLELSDMSKLDFIKNNISVNFNRILTLDEVESFTPPEIETKIDYSEENLELRSKNLGVIKTKLTEGEIKKPVAIVSDGSAVLGFGNIGASAGLPVMEGKAFLFKVLGEVNAIPLCVKTQVSSEIIEIVKLLSNSFSGINLEDISAPRCFEVENTLIEELNIPVFHDDQHGTAIVVLSALMNVLRLIKKSPSNVKIVFSGAGAAACAVATLLLEYGFTNITLVDKDGIVFKGRKENNPYLEKLAEKTNLPQKQGNLENAIEGTDIFIGLSVANILTSKMIQKMNKNPIIFALANPTPEIEPSLAKKAGAFIIATGRSDFPNQVNNSLAFPGLFNGVLSAKFRKITTDMKLQVAKAISSIISEESLSQEYIIPDALNKEIPRTISETIQKIK